MCPVCTVTPDFPSSLVRSLGDPFFPEVNISVTDGAVGEDNVYLGGDRYRWANHIMVDSDRVTLKLEYDTDDHLYTIVIEQ